MNNPLTLRIALGNHDCVLPLKEGRVRSDRLELHFVEFSSMPKAFRQMVRSDDLDISEMALVTLLQAREFGRGLVGMPIPLSGRLPHASLVCPVLSNLAGPHSLHGKAVGIRSYSQTSAMWVRGILEADFGVDPSCITWITKEGAHLPEYSDPPNAVRSPPASDLHALMMAGEIAAVIGEKSNAEDTRTVIPDAAAAAAGWKARMGGIPINHVLAVKGDLLERHQWLAGELMRLFEEAKRISHEREGKKTLPYGLENNRDILHLGIKFSIRQKLVSERQILDEVFRVI